MIAVYISGHGFGHASRQIEIINAAARVVPGLRVLIRSTVPRWLFDRTIAPPFTVDAQPCDTGAVQIDSLRLDARGTIEQARDFYEGFDARVEREADRLRHEGVVLAIVDAPPLACAAAARAGIPSVVVANFTWDWIYREYRDELALAPGLLPTIERAYRTAAAAWRLPMHGGFETFDNEWRAGGQRALVDVPLVARHACVSREDVRRQLGLPADRKIALSSFGGYGVRDLDLSALDCLDDWDVVVTGETASDAPAGVHCFGNSYVYDIGLRYQDLVAASDVVVSKPGYGIVSECIANGTPLVFTPRGRFAEYPVLVEHVERWLPHAFLPSDQLLAGRWRAALTAAHACPRPPAPPTNGAAVIAGMIGALCSADDRFSGPPPLL
jgi:L-arabinokinase